MGVDVRVYERAGYAGGHVRTLQRDGWRHEQGPNSFLGSATPLFDLAEELGLAPVAARAEAKRRYLFLDGKLNAVPSHPFGLVTTPILPASAKLRLLKEPFVRGGIDKDATVRTFFDRRLGPVATERLVDAFVGGIYAGDVDQLGMAAAFPRLLRFVEEYGSIVRGAAASRRSSGGTRGSGARRGTWSFAGGLGDLANGLAEYLGARIQLKADARIKRDGSGWRVNGERTSHVVLATPAFASADLLHGVAPMLSGRLRHVFYAPVVGVHLKVRREDVSHPLDGFGFLAPRREKLRMLGCIWSSSLFDVCEPGFVTLTGICGGGRDPGTYAMDDASLTSGVLADLERAIGLRGKPVDVAIVRHPRAIPQPGPRHLAWRQDVATDLSRERGLHLTGNFFEGVSMGETIAHAERTARDVSAALGVDDDTADDVGTLARANRTGGVA